MRVTLKTSGGIGYFPGLAKPVVADSDRLAPEVSDRLRELVEGASFFHLPPVVGTAPRGAADLRTYALTVEDGRHVHGIAAVETALSAPLRALVDFVKAHGKPEPDDTWGPIPT